MKQIELLDRAAEKLGNDSKVADRIGVSRQRISDIRRSPAKYFLTNYQVALLAEAVGLPPMKTVVAIMAERADDAEEAEYWRGKWRGLAATVLLGLTVLSAGETRTARANAEDTPRPNIQCAQFRRRKNALKQPLAA